MSCNHAYKQFRVVFVVINEWTSISIKYVLTLKVVDSLMRRGSRRATAALFNASLGAKTLDDDDMVMIHTQKEIISLDWCPYFCKSWIYASVEGCCCCCWAAAC